KKLGESMNDAYQAAMLGVLTSRHFTYLVEGEVEKRERLTNHELASRLSYFLWSSMPDSQLFTKAKTGELLTDPKSLESEVDRMLSDSKINRIIDDFPRQWLQLHKLGMFPPDLTLYPDYEVWLEASMREEVVHFFREVFDENLPLDSFIQSDWTMANPRLCEFYGLPEPDKGGFQKVSLRPEHNRGGLLTTGAVLGLTSDGTRHRPVHRGVWVSEAFFGKTPPPPPANVDPIEPNPPDSPKPLFVKNWKLMPRIQIARPVTKTLIHWVWPLINLMQSDNGAPMRLWPREKAPTHRSTRAEKCLTVALLPTLMNSRICFSMIRIGFCTRLSSISAPMLCDGYLPWMIAKTLTRLSKTQNLKNQNSGRSSGQ
ncbi:MAG: DUF1592 domain-containing protein, partial [Rhodospirillaceae bacterium]